MTARLLIPAAVGAAAFVAAGRIAGAHDPVTLARLGVLGSALAAAAVFDLVERRIPNRLLLPAGAGCCALTLAGGGAGADLAVPLAVVVCLVAVSLAQPQALGMGDAKLALLIALGLDGHATDALMLGLFCAALAGAVVLLREGRAAGGRSLPLAPFLATGSLLALLL